MPHGLPHNVRALFDEAVARDLADPGRLRDLVRNHLAAARTAAADSGLIDMELAARIGDGCLALLGGWEDLPESHRRLVQGACFYFAESDDDEDDFESVIGFEDDAEVLNHVASRLGRDDLIIELE